MATKVLAIPPMLFGFTILSNPVMKAICKQWSNTGGRQHILIPTKASLSRDSITGGVVMLDRAIRSADEEDFIEVLGHSQGSQVATQWLEKYDDIDPTKIRFTLLGNPQRGTDFGAKGGVRWAGVLQPDTRNDSTYTVRDITREGDAYANPKGWWNGSGIHSSYNNVDLETLEADYLTKEVVGNTSYYVVP